MRCPECGFIGSRVKDGRPSADFTYRRVRECLKCGHRFKTYEFLGVKNNILYHDPHGNLYPYLRHKP